MSIAMTPLPLQEKFKTVLRDATACLPAVLQTLVEDYVLSRIVHRLSRFAPGTSIQGWGFAVYAVVAKIVQQHLAAGCDMVIKWYGSGTNGACNLIQALEAESVQIEDRGWPKVVVGDRQRGVRICITFSTKDEPEARSRDERTRSRVAKPSHWSVAPGQSTEWTVTLPVVFDPCVCRAPVPGAFSPVLPGSLAETKSLGKTSRKRKRKSELEMLSG